MSRTFTLAEANALIPKVTQTLRATTQLLGRARAIGRQLAEAGVDVSVLNPAELRELPGDPTLAEAAARARLLLSAARDEAEKLERLGLLVKDLERGLVDFRSVLDGEQEVLLCWRLGEPRIGYFHGLDDGFVGRRPIEGHRFFRSRQLVPPRSTE